jgi:hypothetical protein
MGSSCLGVSDFRGVQVRSPTENEGCKSLTSMGSFEIRNWREWNERNKKRLWDCWVH